MSAAVRIEAILRERLAPIHLTIRDDSAKHAGHAGATSGGGHYRIVIVAAAFEGLRRIDQHRLVNEAVRELFGTEIHALSMRTLAPSEWSPES